MNIESMSNVCILFEDQQKAIDTATWLNFKYRVKGAQLFYVIDSPSGESALVSDDIWESFIESGVSHTLIDDYVELCYEQLDAIAKDDDPLKLWEELRGAFSTMDGEILRYILLKKIPLEKFIRHELANRGFDENHKWCGFEKAREIWCSE